MVRTSTPLASATTEDGVETVLGRQFSEREYLTMNPDVRADIAAGKFESGRHHFIHFGHAEGRLGRQPEEISPFFGHLPVNENTLPAFRAEHFPYAGPHPWLDRADWAQAVDRKLAAGEISPDDAAVCRSWAEHGYLILKGVIPAAMLDEGWSAYERAIAAGAITLLADKAGETDPWPGRYLDPHLKIPEICPVMRHPELLRVLRLLMQREPAPFQSIASHKGTQQGAHSDSIHMTTYPLGYLTAAWIAFEDIHPDSGPLVYYPGSHRLPYVFSKDVGIEVGEFAAGGYAPYLEKYEPYIAKLLEENHCRPAYFHAGKGDLLIWHANLIHGGSQRRDLQRSRRALVCHYFVKGAVTYHDLASSRARPHLGTCLLRPPTN
ncbi:MAG: hypothetical protein JWM32_1216 [Verrucomicrobia bacterium]|nr:hypothetical protein [Verrucomicrobiota bacterium]